MHSSSVRTNATGGSSSTAVVASCLVAKCSVACGVTRATVAGWCVSSQSSLVFLGSESGLTFSSRYSKREGADGSLALVRIYDRAKKRHSK